MLLQVFEQLKMLSGYNQYLYINTDDYLFVKGLAGSDNPTEIYHTTLHFLSVKKCFSIFHLIVWLFWQQRYGFGSVLLLSPPAKCLDTARSCFQHKSSADQLLPTCSAPNTTQIRVNDYLVNALERLAANEHISLRRRENIGLKIR